VNKLDPQREGILLDSHPLWLGALERLCVDVGINVVSSGTSAEDVLKLVEESPPDLFVTELHLADGMSSLSCIQWLRKHAPSVRVLVVSDVDDPAVIDEALAAGADAFISKAAQPDDIASALRQVLNQRLIMGPRRPQVAENGTRRAARAGLTRRETEILELVSKGYSNNHIASLLWVAEQTVKFHLSNIYRKLGVSNRTEATRWWFRQGTHRKDGSPADNSGTAASRDT
jgi:DNA-binding NarL/FixJ family response regulator